MRQPEYLCVFLGFCVKESKQLRHANISKYNCDVITTLDFTFYSAIVAELLTPSYAINYKWCFFYLCLDYMKIQLSKKM